MKVPGNLHTWASCTHVNMSYSRNSLKGGYIGDYIGVIKGDAGSLDFSSYEACGPSSQCQVLDIPLSDLQCLGG